MKNIFLKVIILLAVILRFGGIYPGFPPYHPDEGMSYAQGIAIVNEQTLNAHGYSLALAYPGLIPLINAILFKLVFIPAAWIKYVITHIPQILDGFIKFPMTPDGYSKVYQVNILGEREINVLTWGRLIAAAFGVGNVILVYLLTKKLFTKQAGLIASLLVAINYRQVLNSHINLPDIYNAFFLLLAVYLSVKLLGGKKLQDYLLAGIGVGLSVATKFHIYAVFVFLACVLIIFFQELKNKRSQGLSFVQAVGKSMPIKQTLLAGIVGLIVFAAINPYHFIKIEETIYVLADVSRKYGVGRNALSSYAVWYLFYYGIGKFTFVLVGLGLSWSLWRHFTKTSILLAGILPFLYVVTFATNGAFYTRNFVTITPLLLIFPSILLADAIKGKSKIAIGIMSIVLFGLVFENITKSAVVVKEYLQPWNQKLIVSWISKNIPKNSTVASHSSVPVHVDGVNIVKYNPDAAFSLAEFMEQQADFAISNFDWVTNDFYGWMNNKSKQYWQKPVVDLEKYHSAMAIRELSDFSINYLSNNWLAPDSTYIVSKIPKYSINNKSLLFSENDHAPGWISKPIKIDNSTGLVVDATFRGGYVYALFYKNENDAINDVNRQATRLSARDLKGSNLITKTLTTQIPSNVKFVRVGFDQAVNTSNVYLSNLNVYNADVQVDFAGFNVKPVKVDDNLIFPNSHGNL